MQPDSYDSMSKVLEGLGLVGQVQNGDQLVVSSQEGPVWPARGNSFWLSHRQGIWYLSTWLPAGYSIPADQDIVALCSTIMSLATTAMYRISPEIVSRFGLRELDEDEYQRLFSTGAGD